MTRKIARQGNGIRIRLDRGEAVLLASLPAELAAALRERAAPRMAGDDATNEELHHLLDAELAARRVEGQAGFHRRLAEVPLRGGDLVLTMEEGEQWLALLTDLRLALAQRLGIRDESWDRDVNPRRPPSREHGLYYYLSSLQGGLLEIGFGISS